MEKVAWITTLVIAFTLSGCGEDKLKISYFERLNITLPNDLLEVYTYKEFGAFGDGTAVGVYDASNRISEVEALFIQSNDKEISPITKEEFEQNFNGYLGMFTKINQDYMPDLTEDYLWLQESNCFVFYYSSTNWIYLFGYSI